MAFYDLSKDERVLLVMQLECDLITDLSNIKFDGIIHYFIDEDTYIRKTAYLAIGRIYFKKKILRSTIIHTLERLLMNESNNVRQTAINAAGEIGKYDFEIVQHIFDHGLFDPHHAPRNAVIGSIKKMGEVNPQPILNWAKKYLQHPSPEIRREICHGIELRGRKFPQDILPLLKQLQNDQVARVRNTLVHVLGQISYKKGCLKIVIAHLNEWENKTLTLVAMKEIIDVHHRYKNFSAMSQKEAKQMMATNFLNFDELKINIT